MTDKKRQDLPQDYYSEFEKLLSLVREIWEFEKLPPLVALIPGGTPQ
jgi:hypothetical protein